MTVWNACVCACGCFYLMLRRVDGGGWEAGDARRRGNGGGGAARFAVIHANTLLQYGRLYGILVTNWMVRLKE